MEVTSIFRIVYFSMYYSLSYTFGISWQSHDNDIVIYDLFNQYTDIIIMKCILLLSKHVLFKIKTSTLSYASVVLYLMHNGAPRVCHQFNVKHNRLRIESDIYLSVQINFIISWPFNHCSLFVQYLKFFLLVILETTRKLLNKTTCY